MQIYQGKFVKDFMGVMLLSNIKIHEIAKKLNINSKDVLNKAKDLGFNIKSHLSAVSEEDAEKIINSLKNSNITNKEVKKDNNSKKEQVDKGHVIIRREVIISDEDDKKNEKEQTKVKSNNFTQERRLFCIKKNRTE